MQASSSENRATTSGPLRCRGHLPCAANGRPQGNPGKPRSAETPPHLLEVTGTDRAAPGHPSLELADRPPPVGNGRGPWLS